jgi:hypothetical protein
VAPARTPKEIVERLSKETLAIMHDPQVVKQRYFSTKESKLV